ncbi:MAG: hypothetical protein OHK0039_16380 [Bacteroidia bacterium]
MRYLLLASLLLIVATACTPVLFEQPQPKGLLRLGAFPEELRGAYVSERDTIVVGPREIAYSIWHDYTVKTGKLDSLDLEIRDGRLYDRASGRQHAFTVEDDQLKYSWHEYQLMGLSDTLFVSRDDRRSYLNFWTDEGWYLVLLHRDAQGQLVMESLDQNEEKVAAYGKLIDLKPVLDTSGEVDYYIADPSYKQLMRLFEAGAFVEENRFLPVK